MRLWFVTFFNGKGFGFRVIPTGRHLLHPEVLEKLHHPSHLLNTADPNDTGAFVPLFVHELTGDEKNAWEEKLNIKERPEQNG